MENIENVIEHSKIELLNQEVSSLSVHIFDVLNQYKNNGVITEEEFVSLRRDPSKFSKFYNQKGINNEQIDDILKSNERRLAAINERRFLRENAEEEMNKEFKIIDEKISEFAKLKVKAQAAMKTAKDKNDFRIYELMARNYDLMMNICYQYKELVTLNHSSLVSDDLYEIANTKMHRGHEYAYEKSFIDDEINAYSSEINDNRISMAVINERMTTDPNKKMKIKKTIDELKRKPAGIVGNKKPDIIVAPNPIKEDEDGNWYVYEEDLFNDLTNQDVKETSKEEKTSEENKTNSSVKSNENSNGVVNTDANKTTIQKENKTVNTVSKKEPSNPDVYRQVKDTVRNIYMYKSLLGKGVAGLSDEDIKRYVASYEDTIKELRGENNKNLNNADMQKIYAEIKQEENVVKNRNQKPVTETAKKEQDINKTKWDNNSIVFGDLGKKIEEARKNPNPESLITDETVKAFFEEKDKKEKPASKTTTETIKKEQSTNNTGSNNNHIDVNKIFADHEERVRKLRGEDDSSNSFFVTDEEIEAARNNSNNTHQQPEVNATSNDNDYDLDAAILIAQNKLNELLKEKRARDAKNQPKKETTSNTNSESTTTKESDEKSKSESKGAQVKPSTKESTKNKNDVKKFKDPEDSIDEDEIKIIEKEKIDKKDSRFRKLLRKYKKQIAAGIITLAIAISGIAGYYFGKNSNKDLDTEKNKVDDTTQVEETVNPTASAASDKAQATPTPSPVQIDENGDYYINEEDLSKNAGEPVVVPSPPAQEKEPSTQANRPEGYNNDDFNSSANTNSNAQVTTVSNNENKPVTGVSTVATSVNNVNKSFAVDEGTTSSYSSSGGVNSSFATGDNATSSTSSGNSSFATDDNNTSYTNNGDRPSTIRLKDHDVEIKNYTLYDYFVEQMHINETIHNGGTVADCSSNSVLGDEIKTIREENGSDQSKIDNAIAKSKYLLNIQKEDLSDEQLAEFANLNTNLSPDQYYNLCVDTITLTGFSNKNHSNYTSVLNDTVIEDGIGQKVPVLTLGRI